MELKEFQGLALRTESHIDGIKLNRQNLINILKVVVTVTEMLDGIKKAAFYNKTGKLETSYSTHVDTLIALAMDIGADDSDNGALGAVLDEDETISNLDPRVFHGILGIITESGELASAMLKSIEDPNHTVDAVNIQEEMSDIAWYKAILHDTLGLDWNQGLINVINKLRIRYPDKYSDEAADNRNLDAERAALEVGVKPVSESAIKGEDLVITMPITPNTAEVFQWKNGTAAHKELATAFQNPLEKAQNDFITGKYLQPKSDENCAICGEQLGCCPTECNE